MVVKKVLAGVLLFFSFCTFSLTFGETDSGNKGNVGGDLTDGLLLYDAFGPGDQPVHSICANGVALGKAAIVKGGVVGSAVKIENSPVSINQNNFCNSSGTVAFWIKPHQSFSDSGNKSDDIVLMSTAKNRLSCVSRKIGNMRSLFFMTGTEFHKKDFAWDYSCWTLAINSWQAGKWHHVAVTWDLKSQTKKIFIDGKAVCAIRTGLINGAILSSKGEVKFGADNFPATYDELFIWNRALRDDEIDSVFSAPAKVSSRIRQYAQSTKSFQNIPPLKFAIPKIDRPVNTIILPGEDFSAKVPVTNVSDKPFNGKLTLSLIDFHDAVRAQQSMDIKLSPKAKKNLHITFKTPKESGVFKIAVEYEAGNQKYLADVASIAAWPKPTLPPDPDSFFGNHINSMFGGKFVTQAARLGQGWERVHNAVKCTWWAVTQPEPGPFVWDYDRQFNYYKERKMPVLGCLDRMPYWATKTPMPKTDNVRGYAHPPKIDLWEKYVKEVVTHYKDYIKCWEISNEPSVGNSWMGTPEELTEIMKVAYQTIKKIDPTMTVMAAGYTHCAWKWHEEHAASGALKYVDAISIHAFPIKTEVSVEEGYTQLKEILEHFRGLARRYAGKELPIWSTESGCNDTTWFRGLNLPQLPPESERMPINARKGAYRVVQGSALMMAQKVVRHFYFMQYPLAQHSTRSYYNCHMLDVNDAPRPKLMARVAMEAQLRGCTYFGQVRNPEEGRLWAVLFAKPKRQGTVIVWWAGDNGRLKADVHWPGETPRAVDIMGNTIPLSSPAVVTEEPYYIHSNSSPPSIRQVLLEANITVQTPPSTIQAVNDGDKPDIPFLPDYVSHQENPTATFQVDLRPYCNMGLADEKPGDGKGGWSDEGPMNDMRDLPTGLREFYGVPFEIIPPETNKGNAVIALKGNKLTPNFPEKLVIPINKDSVRYLYFLHTAAWGREGVIGKYIITYADGTTVEVANEIPVNNANWWNGYNKNTNKSGSQPKEGMEISKPVPIKVTNTSTGKPAWRYLRVYEWENPHFEKEIKSVEAISSGDMPTPLLLAITGTSQ